MNEPAADTKKCFYFRGYLETALKRGVTHNYFKEKYKKYLRSDLETVNPSLSISYVGKIPSIPKELIPSLKLDIIFKMI